MNRQHAARAVVPAGVVIACIVGAYPTTLAAQAREPESTTSPTVVERFQLARLPKVQLKPQAILPGSVKANASEAQRTNGEVRVPLTAANRQASGSAFRVVTGSGKVEPAANNTQVVKLPARGTTVLSSSDAQKIAADSGLQVGVKTPLPWMVVDTKPRAEEPSGSEVRTARPYLALASAIRWDPEAKLHIAQFQLGIDAEAGDDGKLEDPVIATLSVSCLEVEPRKVELDQIGPAGETVIQVGCDASSPKDPAMQEIRVRLADAELPYKFPIPHQPGAPLLISDATSESGFGVGSVKLTVKNAEADQTPLIAASEMTIQLQTEGASLEPSEVKIPAGSTQATVEVRSRSMGIATIRAVGDLRSDPVEIDFVFPWSFLITTLLGGAAGGYLSFVRTKSKSPKRRSKLVQAIVEGAIVGVLMVVALLVMPGIAGVVPTAARSSVIGWLLMSALAGFVGIELIERLANRVFGKKQADAPKENEPQAKSNASEAARESG
jgi:hypothetical protein